MSLSATIKAIQDIMRKDTGVDGDAQRISQLAWMIFLKIFDDAEKQQELLNTNYKPVIPTNLQWRNWAEDDEGITGDSLIEFINNKLFKELKELPVVDGGDPRNQIVREVFRDAYNYMKSGTLIRQVINKLDEVNFNKLSERHLMNDVYEQILQDLQNAGNAGEYYTPRPVTQFLVEMVDPKLGETVLDPACGTGGFLTSVLEYVRKKDVKTAQDEDVLKQSIYGTEKKPLPHLLCTTNMIMHGIDVPSNIHHDNSLTRPLRDYSEKDRVNVVVTNPPFGGNEEDGIETNFPKNFQTRETADLFLVLILHLLKEGGRAGIVLPDGTLFGEGIKTKIKQKLLEECNLHTIVRLPSGVFAPYTSINTNLLFFTKGESTKEIWYFEHPYPEGVKTYNKTKPINCKEFDLEKEWWNDRQENEYAWKVSIDEIKSRNYNLDYKNPHKNRKTESLTSDNLIRLLELTHQKTGEIISEIKHTVGNGKSDGFDKKIKSFYEKYFTLLPITGEQNRLLKQFRQSILKDAIKGKLVAQDPKDEPVKELLEKYSIKNNKYVKPVVVDEVPYELPSSWSWCRLGSLITWRVGKTPSTRQSDYWSSDDSGIPWVAISDITNNKYINSTKKRVAQITEKEVFKYEPVSKGTLLMSFKLSIGKVGILDFNAYHNEAIISFNESNCVDKLFLYWILPIVANAGNKKSAIKGSTLNSDSLNNLLIPIPPIKEQKRIAQKIEELMNKCDEEEKNFAQFEFNANKLNQLILQELS